MKYLVKKDKKLRFSVQNKEYLRVVLKFLFVHLLNNPQIEGAKKKIIIKYLGNRLRIKDSKTKIVRRCVLTGRARVSCRLFKISRIKLREMLKEGVIPGMVKAIW